MIESIIFIEENMDILKYHKLTAFLKHKINGYKRKKSSILQENYFLMEACLWNRWRCRGMPHWGVVQTLSVENFKQDNSDKIIIVTISNSKNGIFQLYNYIYMTILVKLKISKTENSRFF